MNNECWATFKSCGGYEGERKHAENSGHFIVGNQYKVIGGSMGQSHTSLILDGIPGSWGSGLFDIAGELPISNEYRTMLEINTAIPSQIDHDDIQQKIFDKYPNIFKNVDKLPSETCMVYGLDCGEGWYPLIENVCEFLSKHKWKTDEDFEKEDGSFENIEYEYPNVVFDQVKEKFGELIIYFHNEFPVFDNIYKSHGNVEKLEKIFAISDHYAQGAIEFAQYASSKICEVCGKPGKLCTNGWLKTVCGDHMNELKMKPYKYDKE